LIKREKNSFAQGSRIFPQWQILFSHLAGLSWKDLATLVARTEQLRSQLTVTAGKHAGIQKNDGAVLLVNVFVKLSSPDPTRDRALIVYRLLVLLSL
jgi:hypothetical protein